MKKAFTLIEVNLAVLVMAGGILSVVVLYSLGFRETRQSQEDMASAAYADAVMSPLVAALSSSEIEWSEFNSVPSSPGSAGWKEYLDEGSSSKDTTVIDDPTSKARTAFGDVLGALKNSGISNVQYPTITGMESGLVVLHVDGSSIVKIGFRASKKARDLLAAPLYYTEVVFQGKQEQE